MILVGLKSSIGFQLAFLYFMEFLAPSRRNAFPVLINVLDATNMWNAAVMKFTHNWWIVYWICLGLGLLLIPLLAILAPESPKFLISRGKYSEARKIYSCIAKINKKKKI